MEKNALSRGQQNADCAAPNPCYSTFKLASQKPRHHQNKMQTEIHYSNSWNEKHNKRLNYKIGLLM